MVTADPTAPDPTAVMVRRVIAFYIDLAIYLVAALVPLTLLSDSRPVAVGESLDRVGRLDGGDFYAFKGATVYTISDSQVLTSALIALGVFLLLAVVLQGLTGRTIGKFVTGIRTVRPDGTRPGLVRAFIRELCWIIDGIPTLVLPLVGGILALVTTGRRRIGDMLGRTYVVHRGFAGSAIVHPDGDAADSEAEQTSETDETAVVAPVIAASGADDTVEPRSGAVTDDRAASEAAWAREGDTDDAVSDIGGDGTGADQAVVGETGTDEADAGATALGEPDTVGDEAGIDETGADETEAGTTTDGESDAGDGGPIDATVDSDDGAPASAADRDEPTAPRWDPDRRAYISYDPRRGGWLQHDTETGEWGPISRA